MNVLEVFSPDQIHRVLCIVAHPDDMEYGGSAVVAEWAAKGIEVSYLLLTAGEAGIRQLPPEEVAPLRAAEQQAACEIVGVHELTILDLPDGLVEHSIETRRRISREIRRVRPDAIVTMTWNLEAGWGLNHADHRATGLSVVDAIRDADNPWLYREQLDAESRYPERLNSKGLNNEQYNNERLEPWHTDWLLVMMHDPDRAIEVCAESAEKAIQSLEAHRAYLAALPEHPVPRDLISGILHGGGEQVGTQFALPVRAYSM